MTQRLPSKGIGEEVGFKGPDQANLKHHLALAVGLLPSSLPASSPAILKFYITCILTKVCSIEYTRIDGLKANRTLTFDHEHQIDFVPTWDRTGVSFTWDLLSALPIISEPFSALCACSTGRNSWPVPCKQISIPEFPETWPGLDWPRYEMEPFGTHGPVRREPKFHAVSISKTVVFSMTRNNILFFHRQLILEYNCYLVFIRT